jgi:ABC-3C protein
MITAEQRSWWRIALELKLRKCSGESFQDFFSDVMGKLHGSDFVRVRAFGRRGDKGCDGYLQNSGQVFACYGALNGALSRVSYLVAKMGEDFSKASIAIPSIMKEWHMVHNLVDGLPIEAVEKLKALREADKKRKFGFIGLEGFEERVFALDPDKIQELLGIAANSWDAQNLQPAELRDLITGIAAAADAVQADVTAIRPVPPEKLAFNNLPGHWRWLIAGGWQNAYLVSGYIGQHIDPMIGERVADVFRARYRYLKDQHLAPGAIMSGLYEMVAGVGAVSPQRQVAIQALLAFLFESCDIFEGQPQAAET